MTRPTYKTYDIVDFMEIQSNNIRECVLKYNHNPEGQVICENLYQVQWVLYQKLIDTYGQDKADIIVQENDLLVRYY